MAFSDYDTLIAELSHEPDVDNGSCRYDWSPGYRGIRLHCVAHLHGKVTDTVFRTTWAGHDTLAELLALGLLTGMALEDARRVN